MLLCWGKAWCMPSDPPQGKGDTGTWYFMGKAHAWKDDPLLLLVLFLLSGSGCLVVLGEHPWISGIPFLLSGVHIFCTKWQVWVTSTVDTCRVLQCTEPILVKSFVIISTISFDWCSHTKVGNVPIEEWSFTAQPEAKHLCRSVCSNHQG